MSLGSTTRDLVDRVRALLEAANRRDLDAMMSFYVRDSIWESPPLGTSFKGVAAIRGFHEDWLGAYAEWEIRPEQILDLGHGVGLAVIRQNARPLASSGHVQTRMAVISQWREAKIERAVVYYDIDEARAAAEQLAAERR
jgi:ketosteroid isomerase-like protein